MIRTPRDIVTKFKKRIGTVGPYMCLVDVASQELAKNNTNENLTKLIKGYGHQRLSITELELKKMSIYVNLSHLAFISSRADSFCDDIKTFNKTLKINEKSYNIKSTDKLRKTIFLVHARKVDLKETEVSLTDDVYNQYVGKTELIIVDYYRKMRNVEFHGGLDQADEQVTLTEAELGQICLEYNHRPNTFTNLTVRDVILYSQAWQKLAINVCQNLVDIDDQLISQLCEKYKDSSATRRDNAISKKLKQDYLQPDDIVSKLRKVKNGWIA
ncbi:hypothetical protein [Aliivibrio fischeri]|uniref:hypothetical protein n=1 Tax=Aliivibrio fischeri TaxID=668 RepID=UPI0012DACE07|nr:hypothetical protein [Aliivibrio fischeri]MUK67338.1 hypothetical protein [Aliivibrio fischeri]